MDAERAKLSELQANHLVLSRELAAAKSHDLTRRRELEDRSEEIEQLKRTHADAILNLEMDLKRKERENVDLNDELKYCKNDLERERETVSTLKATISQQSTTQITLTTQNTALQAQVSSLQSALSDLGSQKSQVGLSLDSAMKRIAELEEENQAAERLRRKLHNMIQELKVCPSDLMTSSALSLTSHVRETFACSVVLGHLFLRKYQRVLGLERIPAVQPLGKMNLLLLR